MRSIFAMDKLKIFPPHFSVLTKHDQYLKQRL
jgi:hypothetical protein